MTAKILQKNDDLGAENVEEPEVREPATMVKVSRPRTIAYIEHRSSDLVEYSLSRASSAVLLLRLAFVSIMVLLVLPEAPAAQGQPAVTVNASGAEYVLNGQYPSVLVSVTGIWPQTLSMIIYVTLRSGTSIYVADGTTTIDPGVTATVFCMDFLVVPPGVYNAIFAAVTLSNLAISAPTTPVTPVVTPAETS